MNEHRSFDTAGRWAREVVARRTLIVGVVVAVLHLAVARGWVSQAWSDSTVQAVTAALDALGAVVVVLWARAGVTPVEDPRGPGRVELVPAGVVAPTGTVTTTSGNVNVIVDEPRHTGGYTGGEPPPDGPSNVRRV